uniref:Uncharacterized protein n=1 Tax=Heliothis virescens TaxID=7102 RepID=A0A2A4JFC0_HELVI
MAQLAKGGARLRPNTIANIFSEHVDDRVEYEDCKEFLSYIKVEHEFVKWYKEAGFYTALGEDSASLGTFNFAKYGFIKTPTDYYIRTFIHEAEVNVDLIKLEEINDVNIKQRTETPYADNRSISLFLPIPSNRTCKLAGIDDHWCTCHKSIKISTKSFDARDAAGQLVKYLNDYLAEHRQCAQLKLDEVLEVTEMLAGKPRKNEVGWREFMAVVRTTPGGGVFEGTLRKSSDKWSLAGTVSRLNLYGDQSHCVRHYQLKLYCYCG